MVRATSTPPIPFPSAAAPGATPDTDTAPLEEARLDRKLTVAALAACAGVSEATIYRIARGATTPRPHVVRRLSAVLGRAPREIAEFRRRGDARTAGSPAAGASDHTG